MIYRRCKCGAAERWDTGEMVHPCQGCEKCQTTYATSQSEHKPLEPHVWKPQYDRDTGEPNRRICTRCYKLEKVAS